jgi:hypothetical protein
MYYSYVEIEFVATSFSPARTDLALKLLSTIVMGGTGHEIGVITLIKMEEGSNFYINTQASVTIHLEFLAEHQLKIHSNPNNLSRFHLLWE